MIGLFLIFLCASAAANPYFDSSKVPSDAAFDLKISSLEGQRKLDVDELRNQAQEIMRLDVKWDANNESYELVSAKRERSGTETLRQRVKTANPLGSYIGQIYEGDSGELLSSAGLGTGKEFRRLSRGMSFRFPFADKTTQFRLLAENPSTGIMEEVLRETIDPNDLAAATFSRSAKELEVRITKEATQSPKIVLNIYAEGYSAARKSRFWSAAQKATDALNQLNFPMYDHFEVQAVFSASNVALGSARDLGFPIPTRDSFLGLYFPYWHGFGRWYNVVYPTNFEKYRNALANVPYDYPLVIVDSSSYWGVGNFMELTAIPADNSNFAFLLYHEIGHFFGLNEEYNGGGPTELEFAPNIEEPWSQNITFHPQRSELKWIEHVASNTRLPTPSSDWSSRQNGPIGAYRGGYADSEPQGRSHIPGKACLMATGRKFCPVCDAGLEKQIKFDLGLELQQKNR